MSTAEDALPEPVKPVPNGQPALPLIRLARDRSPPSSDPGASFPSSDPPKKDDDWETVATFVVEFERRKSPSSKCQADRRTRAHHMQSGETSVWYEYVTDVLLSWMLGRFVRDEGHPRLDDKKSP